MRIVFAHHSIGRHCLQHGLRDAMRRARPDIDLWDVDYRKFGAHDEKGDLSPYASSLAVPGDNTDPDGLAAYVEQLVAARGSPGMPSIDGLILKSCYTGARIKSDAQLDRYLRASLRTVELVRAAGLPTVLLTPVPDSPLRSSATVAARARLLGESVAELVDDQQCVSIINLHAAMGDERGCLRAEFRRLGGLDAHLNGRGLDALIHQIVAAVSASWFASETAGRR